MNGPAEHLSWAELACRDGTPYPTEWRTTRGRLLGIEFEALRSILGAALVVLSGYRTDAHNRQVGGSRHSQHVRGRALDLKPRGKPLSELERAVRARLEEEGCQIRGLGLYPSFVHVDIRPSPRLVTWYGGRRKADM